MHLFKWLMFLGLALGAALPARALEVIGPIPNTSTFAADNKAVIVYGDPIHTAHQQFIAAASFTVSGPSFIVGEILAGNQMPISGVTFYNQNVAPPGNSFLAADYDGSDGFLVSALAPTAGTYSFVMSGSNASGTIFLAVIAAVPYIAPVPEPATWALILAGLCLIAPNLRRTRAQELAQAA